MAEEVAGTIVGGVAHVACEAACFAGRVAAHVTAEAAGELMARVCVEAAVVAVTGCYKAINEATSNMDSSQRPVLRESDSGRPLAGWTSHALAADATLAAGGDLHAAHRA